MDKKSNRFKWFLEIVSSIRFRIAVFYSVILFFLSTSVTAIIYFLLERNLGSEEIVQLPIRTDQSANLLYLANLEDIDRLANEQALESLRNYSLVTLGGLFIVSMIVGWFVAGRTLKPIKEITSVMDEIHSSKDLSRRISKESPNDELKKLADTFDEMLEDIEESFRKNVSTLEATVNFVRETSHEIRNPMQIIRTNLQIVSSDENADVKDYKETIGIVNKSIDRMSKVIDNLTQSDYYRFIHKDYLRFDLAILVMELKEEFAKIADSKGVKLRTNAQSAEILGDQDSLKQAIINLLTNSIEALENHSNGKPNILLNLEVKNGLALLSVEDNGPGIAVENQTRVFARNQRGKGSAEKGRGLGLTIVRQVVEAHGGKIELYSDPGNKTVFSVSLPLALD